MCYYDGFKVNWTGDFTNDNGVIVIAEWNGVTMYDPAQDVSIINVDIVEDTGEAILNTHLFDEMPDEALVNLWLIKGNLLTITGVDINSGEHNITLEDAAQLPPEVLDELLSSSSEALLQLQPFMFGTGAVTGFSFFLIREL